MQTQPRLILDPDQQSIGLKTALNILDKWQVKEKLACALLRLSKASYHRAKKGIKVSLDSDQLTRISLLLNMHATLRTVFENPNNVYGFMSMKNDNPFFDGRSPLEAMSDGSLISMYETFRRIDALRGGSW